MWGGAEGEGRRGEGTGELQKGITYDPPKPCSDEVRLSSVPSFLSPSCSEGLYFSPPLPPEAWPPLAPSTCGSGPSLQN